MTWALWAVLVFALLFVGAVRMKDDDDWPYRGDQPPGRKGDQ